MQLLKIILQKVTLMRLRQKILCKACPPVNSVDNLLTKAVDNVHKTVNNSCNKGFNC